MKVELLGVHTHKTVPLRVVNVGPFVVAVAAAAFRRNCCVSWALWPATLFVHVHNASRPPPTSSRPAKDLLGSVRCTVESGRAYARDDLFADVVRVDKCVRACEEAIKEGLGNEGARLACHNKC